VKERNRERKREKDDMNIKHGISFGVGTRKREE
jgi:hypothetical protein